MTLTSEQESIFTQVEDTLNNVYANNSEIYISAVAGSGKTTLARYIVSKLGITNYIYTAFNKKIVEEGTKHFGSSKSKTFHALAWSYCDNPNIGSLYASNVIANEFASYLMKKDVVDTLDAFCLSSYDCLSEYCIDNDVSKEIEDLVELHLIKMSNREIPHTFNFMLKELHLNLLDSTVKIDLDILIVDECQDITPVMLEIFTLINAKIKLYLGDVTQSIYTFLGLVSAYDKADKINYLTNSFRVDPNIAKRIELFCNRYLDEDFTMVGINTSKKDTTKAYITYSNAAIIKYIIDSGETEFNFTKPVKEIFEVPLNVLKIMLKQEVKNPKYYTFKQMIRTGVIDKENLDDDIASAYSIVRWAINMKIDLVTLSTTIKHNPKAKLCIATAHSIKGAEFGTVTICDSLNSYVTTRLSDTVGRYTDKEKEEAAKLYYVATSRCKHTLNNATLLP
jgi:hypothetical protein